LAGYRKKKPRPSDDDRGDGPFIETKELVGGFAIIAAKSKEESIELTKRFLNVAGDGETEIRLLHEMSDFAPESLSVEAVARV
jgi:hypothetical protein